MSRCEDEVKVCIDDVERNGVWGNPMSIKKSKHHMYKMEKHSAASHDALWANAQRGFVYPLSFIPVVP